MKAIVIAFLLLATTALGLRVQSPRLEELSHYTFDDFARAFGKSYKTAEERARREQIFNANLKMVRAHNAKADKMYTMNVNHMSDWSDEEFLARLTVRKNFYMQNVVRNRLGARAVRYVAPPNERPAASVDWRNHTPSVVTPVKKQGSCGSCWAHSSTETMESFWAIATGKLYVLSTEQVTLCTPNVEECGGKGKCNGNIELHAYKYAIDNNGLVTNESYPYTAKDAECLVPPEAKRVATFKKAVIVPANDQNALLNVISNVGPIAVSVWVNSKWRGYYNGIFDGCEYDKNMDINHGVQLVGYGTDAELGKDYWIVRNSWGDGWGEDGYIRVLREKEAKCGWDKTPKDGSACQDDPDDPIKVCGQCGILSGSSYPIV